MSYSEILARLRKERGHTQAAVADYLTKNSKKPYSIKNVSSWETGYAMPPVEPFLLLCELYGVRDINETFRGVQVEYRGMNRLNPLGISRAEEYIAMLAGIESLLSAVVADGMTGHKHRSNMELIAQGAANIVSPIFGGIPSTGAIARTATNIKNGGRTRPSYCCAAFSISLLSIDLS